MRVFPDKSQQTEKYSEADFTHHSGISTAIDAAHAIAHNKIILIDDSLVLTGSFNFTKAAEEHNAENLLVSHDPILAKRYLENWPLDERHSRLYQRDPAAAEAPRAGGRHSRAPATLPD